MTQINYLNEILHLLKSYHINISQIDKEYLCYEEFDRIDKNKLEDEWIKKVYEVTDQYLTEQRNYIEKNNVHTFISKEADEEIKKFLCLYANNSIILEGNFFQSGTAKGDMEYYEISTNFLKQIFKYEELIRNEIINILPSIIESRVDENQMQTDVNSIEGKYDSFYNNDILSSEYYTYISRQDTDKLYFILPWLYGAKIENYIEIVNRNKTCFKNYKNLIDKLGKQTLGESFDNIAYEIREANINLQIEFERAKQELKKNGLKTMLGVACVLIPIVMPFPAEIKAVLSSILGTTTLKDCAFNMIDNFNDIKMVGRTNPFWMSWRWERSCKKKIRLK